MVVGFDTNQHILLPDPYACELLEKGAVAFLALEGKLHSFVSHLLIINHCHNLNVTNPTTSSIFLDHDKRPYQNSPSGLKAASAFVPQPHQTECSTIFLQIWID